MSNLISFGINDLNDEFRLVNPADAGAGDFAEQVPDEYLSPLASVAGRWPPSGSFVQPSHDFLEEVKQHFESPLEANRPGDPTLFSPFPSSSGSEVAGASPTATGNHDDHLFDSAQLHHGFKVFEAPEGATEVDDPAFSAFFRLDGELPAFDTLVEGAETDDALPNTSSPPFLNGPKSGKGPDTAQRREAALKGKARTRLTASFQRSYICKLCTPNFITDEARIYGKHLKNTHPEQNKFHCWVDDCTTFRATTDEILKHYFRMHVAVPFRPRCNECTRPFARLDDLKRHMTCHFPEEREVVRANIPLNKIPSSYTVECICVRKDEGVEYYGRKPGANIVVRTRSRFKADRVGAST